MIKQTSERLLSKVKEKSCRQRRSRRRFRRLFLNATGTKKSSMKTRMSRIVIVCGGWRSVSTGSLQGKARWGKAAKTPMTNDDEDETITDKEYPHGGKDVVKAAKKCNGLTFHDLTMVVMCQKSPEFMSDMAEIGPAIFRYIDDDNTGEISCGEIMEVIHNDEALKEFIHSLKAPVLTSLFEKDDMAMRYSFGRIDTDASGHIDEHEWMEFLGQLQRDRLEYFTKKFLVSNYAFAGRGMDSEDHVRVSRTAMKLGGVVGAAGACADGARLLPGPPARAAPGGRVSGPQWKRASKRPQVPALRGVRGGLRVLLVHPVRLPPVRRVPQAGGDRPERRRAGRWAASFTHARAKP
mmetsp:Transcript_64441/g.145339  ORF Transcript_64441/g.145339 Transcript_64441/m.145339 type:complete len:351 (+) Transcript_64441:635-1687(+)